MEGGGEGEGDRPPSFSWEMPMPNMKIEGGGENKKAIDAFSSPPLFSFDSFLFFGGLSFRKVVSPPAHPACYTILFIPSQVLIPYAAGRISLCTLEGGGLPAVLFLSHEAAVCGGGGGGGGGVCRTVRTGDREFICMHKRMRVKKPPF